MVFKSLVSFGGAKAVQTISAGLLLSALAADATRIEVESRNVPSSVVRALALARRGSKASALQRRQANEDLQSFMDLVFVSPITLGGTEYKVIVDTSSSDLWVDRAPETSEQWDVAVDLAYAYPEGKLTVNGTVGTAALQFGEIYNIDEQAFVNVDEDFLTATGTNGIMGLGLERVPSSIQTAVQQAEGEDATWGASILTNLFAQKNDESNYVTLNLRRAEGSPETTAGGTVTISDVEPQWAAIKEQPKIPVYPAESKHWTVQLDHISIAGHHIPLESNTTHAPGGKSVALVSTDLSAPSGFLPAKVFDELYSRFGPEAVRYDSPEGWVQYIVPCKTPAEVTYTINGHHYPLHPLDITQYWDKRPDALKDYAVCISALKCKQGTENWDVSLGSAFMKNTYTLFDFGDYEEGSETLGAPYLQFIAKTNHSVGTAEFTTARAQSLLPELSPAEVVKVLNGGAAPSPGGPEGKTKPRPHHGKTSDSSKTTGDSPKHNVNMKTGGESDSDNASSSSSSSTSTWAKFMPAIIALLAVNLVVALVLMVLGVMNYIKKSGAAKSGVPHYIPVSKGADGQHTIIFDSEAGGSKAAQGGYASGSTRYGD